MCRYRWIYTHIFVQTQFRHNGICYWQHNIESWMILDIHTLGTHKGHEQKKILFFRWMWSSIRVHWTNLEKNAIFSRRNYPRYICCRFNITYGRFKREAKAAVGPPPPWDPSSDHLENLFEIVFIRQCFNHVYDLFALISHTFELFYCINSFLM